MPNGEKEQRFTEEGFPIRTTKTKSQKKQEKKQKKVRKGMEKDRKKLEKINRKKGIPTVDPNIKSLQDNINVEGEDFVDLNYKNSFTPDVSGGSVDADGHGMTPKNELIKTITKVDDPNDGRTLEQIDAELEATKEFDTVLNEEQEKVKNLQFYLDGDVEKLQSPDVEMIPTNAGGVPFLTTTDIENETANFIEGLELGDMDSLRRFDNFMNNVNRMPIDYGEPALERLGLQDYYPDINTPLQVGTYSGSIVGNNPIFVAGGGYIPVGIIDARRRALERAAANKVKKGEKLKELMLVDSAEQYQDKIHEIGLGIFNKYGEAAGWDYYQLMDMNNPLAREFQSEYQNYRANAKRTIAIQKQYETVLKDLTDGDKYVPPSVLKAMEDWQSGMWSMDALSDPELLQRIEREMQSYDHMTKDAEALSKDIQKDQTFFGAIPETEDEWAEYNKELETIKSSRNYDILRSGTFKYVPVDRIARLVDLKVDYGHYFNPDQTKMDMFQYLNDLISQELFPKYIEANKKGVNVTVNNRPNAVTQSNESRILGNQDKFKTDLTYAVRNGDAAVYDVIQSDLGLTPNVDSESNFINGEIRANYSLTKDQNNGEFNYTVGDMTFIPSGTNEKLTLRQYQDRIIQKNGIPYDTDTLLQLKLDRGMDDIQFYDALVDGSLGVQFNEEEAYVLSLNDQSYVDAKWTKKQYVQKYRDQNNQWQVVTMNDNPEVISGSTPWNEVSGGVLNPNTGGVFAGFSFYTEYNLNEFTGGLVGADTYNEDGTAVMNKQNKQGNQSATKSDGGTGTEVAPTTGQSGEQKVTFN